MTRSCRILIGFPLLIALLSGCRSSAVTGLDVTRTPESQSLEPSLPLVTSVAVRPRSLVAGDAIHVDVTVTNRGPDTVRVQFPSGCQLMFELRDSFGRRLVPNHACPAIVTPFEIAPGETKSQSFDWTTAQATYPERRPLRPGRYKVVGGLVTPYPRLAVPSAPVTVWLLPRSDQRMVFPPGRF
jgi:hypothetical protein